MAITVALSVVTCTAYRFLYVAPHKQRYADFYK
jgi:hypothetical protein